MKTNLTITLGIITLLFFGSQTFAADMMTGDHMMIATGIMMDDTMKKDDKMMADTTISDKEMMMKDYEKLSVAVLAKKMGYTWKTNRKILAEKAEVTNYKGSAKQNLKIREYLLTIAK